MAKPISFPAECPHCHQERIQPGFDAEELRALLGSGSEIEAYCSSCDESWPISIEERADLERLLRGRQP